MNPDRQTASLEELLAHSGWIRALAKSLLADEHQAEDVSQETLRVALERRPYGGAGLQAWLFKVARGLALNLRRGELRRQVREEKVGRHQEAVPSSGEIVEWAERMRELALAVSTLGEPYQSAIVLRYFEGLSAHEIATRLGIPASTVRSHLKRGLQRLRVEMKSRYGNDNFVPCLTLLGSPLAGSTALTVSTSISLTTWISQLFVMSTKTKLALSAALIVLTSWAFWPAEPVEEATADTFMVEANPQASLTPTGTLPGELEKESGTKARVEIQADEKLGHGTIKIQIIDLNGNAIEGALVQASYGHPNWFLGGLESHVIDSRRASANIEASSQSNESGLAVLHGLKTKNPILIFASKDGYAYSGKMYSSTEGANEQHFGRLVLNKGGSLALKVVTQDRQPVPGADITLSAEPVEPAETLYIRYGKTDSSGYSHFPFLVQKPLTILVTAPGFLPKELHDIPPSSEDGPLQEVQLDKGLSIYGSISEFDQSPAESVPLYLLTEGESSFQRPHNFHRGLLIATSDSQGNFRASGLLPEKEYRILARRGIFNWAVSDAILAGSRVEISMPTSHTVRGNIVKPDGKPALRSGIGFVNVEHPSHGMRIFQSAEKDGRFEIDLAEASYGGMAKSRNGQLMLPPFELKADLDLGHLVLSPGVPLTITAFSSLDESPVPFPHFSERIPQYYFSGTAVDTETWKRRIRSAASHMGFSMNPTLEDHVTLLNYLQPGHHTLNAVATGYSQKSIEVDLEENQPQELTIHFQPTARVIATIRRQDGTPVADQEFHLLSIHPDGSFNKEGRIDRGTTNSEGTVIFGRVPPGLCRLESREQRWSNRIERFETQPGENRIECTIPTMKTLRISALDGFGPVSGAKVWLWPEWIEDGFPRGTGETNAEGEIEFKDLWPGEYAVRVEQVGKPRFRKLINLTKESQNLEIRFEGATLSGLLPYKAADQTEEITVNLSGFELPEAEILNANWEALQEKNWKSMVHSRTRGDQTGKFEFNNVRPGIYRLSLYAPGFQHGETIAVNVFSDDLEGIEVPSLIQESLLLLTIKGFADFVHPSAADYYYATLFDQQNHEVLKRSFIKDGVIRFERLAPGSHTLRISSILTPSIEETDLASLSIVLGAPGSTTVVEWPPSKE